ncbi:uncharacterized protein HD556DRAFT_1456179 [Suillus plorans]|uniref:NET domain-containing protein n=1 Tax=Suillus plorans TaxID=116603 RepID=A0A9P7AC69_9AGAM|nr:uncharacterized protein HD556DRAFT_1456179 [Suillus plorans]KAG1785938.1 hypothetical protein HD556DRAFT_1456179 [Suillus plorans]
MAKDDARLEQTRVRPSPVLIASSLRRSSKSFMRAFPKFVFKYTEEIELEIDILPPHVLTKLYNFVLWPLQHTNTGIGKGTGTGGLKQKGMGETAEAEKIHKLGE